MFVKQITWMLDDDCKARVGHEKRLFQMGAAFAPNCSIVYSLPTTNRISCIQS